MSHDTHHAHSTENKAIISFKNSFWLVIILVGLFVAALNFIQVESASSEEGHGAHGAAAGHDAHGTAGGHEAHGAGSKSEKHEAAGHEAATHTEEAKPAEAGH